LRQDPKGSEESQKEFLQMAENKFKDQSEQNQNKHGSDHGNTGHNNTDDRYAPPLCFPRPLA
jgi:hypothetical protein